MTDARTELERKIIAGCLNDTAFFPSLQYWLFSNETRRRLVEVLQAIHKRGEPLEPSYIALESAKYDSDLEKILLDEWRFIQQTELPQNTETLLLGLINNNIEPISEVVISKLKVAAAKRGTTINDIIEIIEVENNRLFEILPKKIITTIHTDIENAAHTFFKSDEMLIPTGIYKLDEKLGGGLRKSEISVIAARPGNLKTGLAMQVAKNIALSKRKCLVFSLEMSKETILHSLISSLSGVSQTLPFNDFCHSKVNYAANMLRDAADKLILYDNIYSMPEAINIIEKQKPDVVFVDFIQQFRFSAEENMRFDIMRLMKAFKVLAKRMEIPIVLVSQLSRGPEQRVSKRPRLSDLAESSSIEWFAADILALRYPENDEIGADGLSQRNKLEIFALKKRYSGAFATILWIVPETKNIFSDEMSMLQWRSKCPQALKADIGDLLSKVEK